VFSPKKLPQDQSENENLPLQKKERRFPSLSKWRYLPQILSKRERITLGLLIVVFLGSFFLLSKNIYVSQTHIIPAKGGHLIEGMIGSPRFLNPVYATTDTGVDRTLVELIFSGLLSYNGEGELVADLAKDLPDIEEGGRVFTFDLKENVQWHDGTAFTADDVVFTIKTIQDPQYKSTVWSSWIGVDVEKVSDHRVRIRLLEPYAPFLERLTLKIIPAHIWSNITPENFPLSRYNLDPLSKIHPVGTGPYRVTRIVQGNSDSIEEIQLKANQNYHNNPPLLQLLTIRFFENEEQLIKEANRGNIHSFSVESPESIAAIKNPAFTAHAFTLPQYFAVFFNTGASGDEDIVASKNIRQALKTALNKQEIVDSVLKGNGKVVHSPFLPELFGFQQPQNPQQQDTKMALALFQQEGFIQQEGKLGKTPPSTSGIQIDLTKDDQGSEVRRLQTCLANPPAGGSDIYPEGIINGNFGSLTQKAVIRFQEKYAEEVLAPIGLTEGTGKAGPLTREKLNALCFPEDAELIPLRIVLTTIDESPLREVAEAVKAQWEELGVEVEVQTYARADLKREVIRPREYQALLVGEILGRIPDPFPFWHSLHKKDPGFNLSVYENKKVDGLLEKARKELDEAARAKLYEEAQDILLADVPAIFLYDQNYLYFVSNQVENIHGQLISNPSERFAGITDWYIETKRVWK